MADNKVLAASNDFIDSLLYGQFYCKKIDNTIKSYNSNSNNQCDFDHPELSDWEHYNLDDNLSHSTRMSDDKSQFENTDQNLKRRKNNSNYDNFEIISPQDDECDVVINNVSTISMATNTNSSVLIHDKSNTTDDSLFKQLITEIISMNISFAKGFYEGAHITYLLFKVLINFILEIIQRIYTYFKDFTKRSIFIFLIKIIISFILHIVSIVKWFYTRICHKKKKSMTNGISKKVHSKYKSMNTNNSAVVNECTPDNVQLCFYVMLIVVAVAGWFCYCWSSSDSKVCSVDNAIDAIKLSSLAVKHEMYMLPGEDCMKAGRCCKGFMEAGFRWLTCIMTLPIRTSLTAWPRRNDEKEETSESIGDLRISVDKIIREIGEENHKINKQEELIMKLKWRFAALEKLMVETTNDIIVMTPELKSLTKTLDWITLNLTTAENQMKNVISIRQDFDKINELMKNTVREPATANKVAFSKLQTLIQGEKLKLESRVEILESLVKDYGSRASEFTDRWLYKVKSDLDLAKLTQDEIRKRLISLKDIPARHNEMSNKLKSDVKAKLADELLAHNELSKNTECVCMKEINKFKKDLEKSKSDYTCIVEKLVDKESKIIQKNVKSEISKTFYDKTVEIAKKEADEALANHFKDDSSRTTTVKAAGFLSKIERDDIAPDTCDNDITQLLDLSASCQSDEEIKNTFTDNDKCLSDDQIRKIVKLAVAKYTADRIGVADFALESMGGSVIASRSSSTYSGRFSIFSFMSIPLTKVTNSLRKIIQPNNQPGDCWPFAGSTGYAAIQLSHKIIIKAVTLEHLSASLGPDGTISSAPKQFNIFNIPQNAMEKEELIGSFEYKIENGSIQTFFVQNPQPVKMIQLQVLSNHGNKDFTCVYRIRAHGSLIEEDDRDK